MKRIIKLTAFMLAVLMLSALVGCSLTKRKEKVFEEGGLKITLDDSYISSVSDETGNLTFMSYSSGCAIVAKNESFARLKELKYEPEKMTSKAYADIIVKDNKFDTEVKEDGQLVYFEHTIKNDEEGKTFKYFSVVYKSTEAFWLVHFGCTEDVYEENRADFVKFANTVSF